MRHFSRAAVLCINSFDYEKDQSSPPPDGDKTRYFNIDNTTVMANVIFNGSGLSGPFSYKNENLSLETFVSVGIGVALNTVKNFYSIQAGTDIPFSLMKDNAKTDFVYQLGAGINFRTNKNIGMTLGYRYVDASNFETSNVLEGSLLRPSVKVIPWTGNVKMNEAYLTLNYYL